jgi:hypothetical protein
MDPLPGVGAVTPEIAIPRVTVGTGAIFTAKRYMRMVGTFGRLKFARATTKPKDARTGKSVDDGSSSPFLGGRVR